MKAIGGEYVVFRNARKLSCARNFEKISKMLNFSNANGQQRDNSLECNTPQWKRCLHHIGSSLHD